jgi:hypothetical protein
MPSDYVNFALSMVYECGGKVYRSFRPSAVTDFDAGSAAGDVIQLDRSLATSFAMVMAVASQSGGNVVIAFDALNTIRLSAVDLGSLTASDFAFG